MSVGSHSSQDSGLAAALDEEFAFDYVEEGMGVEEDTLPDIPDSPAHAQPAAAAGAAGAAAAAGQASDSEASMDAMAEALLDDMELQTYRQVDDDEPSSSRAHTSGEPAGTSRHVLPNNGDDGPIASTSEPRIPLKRHRPRPPGGTAPPGSTSPPGGTISTPDDGLDLPDGPEQRRRLSATAAVTGSTAVAGVVHGRGGSSGPAATTAAPAAAACSHPGFMAGMCIVCGELRSEGDDMADFGRPPQARAARAPAAPGNTSIRHLHMHKTVEVTAAEARRLRSQTVGRLLSSRKLVLILDLDHTLLNSVKAMEVPTEQAQTLLAWQQREADQPHQLLHQLCEKFLWTKLRPFVYEFLEQASELFEMHIYTMGDKNYAREICRILDPQKKYFAGRVISSNDSTSTHSKDLDVVLSSDALVVILDDTEQVWPKHRQNLIQVERYHFFPASIRMWNPTAQALLDRDCDESADSGMLATCLRVLKQLHEKFFEEASVPLEQRDVRHHLRGIRESILLGCHLTFSHCWPQNTHDCYSQPLWRLAESLGAECCAHYQPDITTHVVSATNNTDKVNRVLADGGHAVATEWLSACSFRWQRLPEADFPVVAKSASRASGAGKSDRDELALVLKAAGGGSG